MTSLSDVLFDVILFFVLLGAGLGLTAWAFSSRYLIIRCVATIGATAAGGAACGYALVDAWPTAGQWPLLLGLCVVLGLINGAFGLLHNRPQSRLGQRQNLHDERTR